MYTGVDDGKDQDGSFHIYLETVSPSVEEKAETGTV